MGQIIAIPPKTIKMIESSEKSVNFNNHFLSFKPYDFKGRKKKDTRTILKK